jgi:hypothetical protein
MLKLKLKQVEAQLKLKRLQNKKKSQTEKENPLSKIQVPQSPEPDRKSLSYNNIHLMKKHRPL